MVPSWSDQLLPQLLMEQFDTLPIQYRHIELMHEGVWLKKKIWQIDSYENLYMLLYVHGRCLHVPINSYHSFWCSNLILCLYNIDTLNICMKEFDSEFFWQNDSCENLYMLLYVHGWCLHGPINSYHSFWWKNLILCLYNADTLNIHVCMKEFGSEKIIFDKMTAVRTYPKKAFVYALMVPSWADQLLPQLLMEQFDTLPL